MRGRIGGTDRQITAGAEFPGRSKGAGHLNKFLINYSLLIAILVIWGFSIAVAMADVKDDLLAKIRKQVGRARLRPVDPLAGRSVAETLAPTAMDERERWVFHLVSGIAISLRLHVRILVLQDSMEHYVVHFAQGKRLTTYRVDKAWVADAMAGKADQRDRIYKAVEQYLRQEFLGGQIAPKPAPAPAPASSPGGATPAPKPAAPAPAAGSPGAPPAAAPQMSREEMIAAARAKAEALRAQRAAGGSPPPQPPKDPAQP